MVPGNILGIEDFAARQPRLPLPFETWRHRVPAGTIRKRWCLEPTYGHYVIVQTNISSLIGLT
jgi:hypothetical protein